MTEAREQAATATQAPGSGSGGSGMAALEVRAEERRDIGARLHRGILQELTVAGLRLRVIETAAAAPTAAAIAELAAWLSERQGELRRYVAELEQAGGEISIAAELALLAETMETQHNCRLTIGAPLRAAAFAPEISGAMLRAIRGLAAILAAPLGAHNIDIALDHGQEPTLRITHDGGGLQKHMAELAAVRRLVGHNGASLRVEARRGADMLIVDWTN